MRFLTAFKNIFLLIFLVGVVYLFSNYAEPVKTMVFGMLNIPSSSVLGASSQRAGNFSQKVGSDIGSQFESLKKQAMSVKVGDIVNTLSRVQKIPQDIKIAGDFIKEQADNMLQSKK